MYRTPTDFAGFSKRSVSTGRNAASVLPDAVPEDKSRLLSVSKMTSHAATWTARSSDQPLT